MTHERRVIYIINNNNYTMAEIMDELHNLDGKRTIGFRFDLLNKSEVKIGEISCMEARITYGENNAIMRSGVFQMQSNMRGEIDFLSDRLRPWFILHMPEKKGARAAGTVEWPLGIFLLTSPRLTLNGAEKSLIIGAYDKTVILEEDRFTNRFHISKGSPFVSTIQRILATSGISMSRIAPSDAVFADDIEFPRGKKKHDAINDLLRQINYTKIFSDNEGNLCSMSYVSPFDRLIDFTYDSGRNSVLYADFTEYNDLVGVANVFTRVALNVNREEMISTYANDSPQNPLSTVRRGRHIVDFAQISNICDQAQLDIFTKRIAVEQSMGSGRLIFKTPLLPGHNCFDTLFLNIPEVLDAPSKFSHTGWEMDLRVGGTMTHEARRVMRL